MPEEGAFRGQRWGKGGGSEERRGTATEFRGVISCTEELRAGEVVSRGDGVQEGVSLVPLEGRAFSEPGTLVTTGDGKEGRRHG